VNDKSGLIPLGLETKIFKDKIYFRQKNGAREYLLLNFLLQKHTKILAHIYDTSVAESQEPEDNKEVRTFDDMVLFTIVERDYGKKHDMLPHYIMLSVSSSEFVLCACDNEGNSSSNKCHWKPIKKNKQGKKRRKNFAS
jgi:hypothetical protein